MNYIKEKIILNYLKQFNNSPRQNSKEWLTARLKTIGGSEISSIEGVNPYKGLKDLIESKLAQTPWAGNIATNWGKLFEDVVQYWCEYLFDTSIQGTSAFILNGNTRTSYSPDGIGLATYESIYKDEKQPLGIIKNRRITLYEFKAPFRRYLKQMPPKYYISQVKMGLNIIDICEIGLLVESVFRRCSLEQLNFEPNDYDKKLHMNTNFYHVYVCGIIYVYDDFNTASAPVDYGACEPKEFEQIIKKITSGKLKKIYSDFILPNSNAFNDITVSHPNFIGYIPWKMVNVKYHIIERDPFYLESHMKKINDVIDLIDRCSKDKSKKDIYISKYFNTFDLNDIFESDDCDYESTTTL